MANYFYWGTQPPRGGCVVSEVRNFDGLVDMKRGRTGSIAGNFPDDVQLVMDPKRPKDVKLYDQLHNLDRLVVTSPHLIRFLKGLNLSGVEYLPVQIVDHKGNVASPDYAIVNPYNVFDCIDRDATEIEWNDVDPELIAGAFDLAFDDSKIDPAVSVFRVKHMARYVFVRKNIAEQINAQKFEGPYMTPLDQFDA